VSSQFIYFKQPRHYYLLVKAKQVLIETRHSF